MQSSVTVSQNPAVKYLLRLGDTCLILGQRLSEWCGHAPVLEEDIAMANMALDLIGQSRALLTHAGQLSGNVAGQSSGVSLSEDQLAFLREERDYLNPILVELPNGMVGGQGGQRDFALTVLRNAMVATFLQLMWQRLATSSDAELAAIAGKAVKEARYHQQHSGDWVVRLGDGTADSHQRMQAALNHLWPYSNELFSADAVDEHAAATGLGPRWADLRGDWLAQMHDLLEQATLDVPADSAFLSDGKRGVHSEHMGFILTQMQYLQRAYPGGVW
jgi:ring-1,2-phenylacetyl-CoA epoxidase subunit PaaC